MELAALCEQYRDGFLGQPASAMTSAAFVVAAAGILVSRRHNGSFREMLAGDRQTLVYAALVAGIGAGSFIQHGPNPDWQAYAHDLPLTATLFFLAANAVRDLTRRDLRPSWWLIPTAAMVPVVAAGSTASTVAQAAMAGTAIGLNLLRARRRPALRRTVIVALVTVVAGSVIGALTDRTPLCQPNGLLQGHAVWHVLAAAALWQLAPAIGATHRRASRVAAVSTPVA